MKTLRLYLVAIATAAIWTVEIDGMKFGLIFNVAKDKADLMISEDSDIDLINENNNSSLTVIKKPKRKKTSTTTTTTEKEPWQEIDETRSHEESEGELDNVARYIFRNPFHIQKKHKPVIATTTVLSEVITRTEILYPTCLVLTTALYDCEAKSFVDSSSTKTDIQPTKINQQTIPSRIIPLIRDDQVKGQNENQIDVQITKVNQQSNLSQTLSPQVYEHQDEEDQDDAVQPTKPVLHFSTSLWVPDEDLDSVQSSFIELSYNDEDENAELVWRRSTKELNSTTGNEQSPSETTQSPPKTTPLTLTARKIFDDEYLTDTIYHTQTIVATKVLRYTDNSVTVTVLADACPSTMPEFVANLPLCRPLIYPVNVPLLNSMPRLSTVVNHRQSDVENSVANIYRIISNLTALTTQRPAAIIDGKNSSYEVSELD